MRNRVVLVLTALFMMMLLGGCATQASAPYREVRPASIAPGELVPAPAQEVILTISGDIAVTNVGETLQLDMPTLESLRLVEFAVQDPYRLEEVVYTGVLLSDLREYLGVSESSEKFHISALDDYRVDLSFADVKQWPILLATRSNGEYMTVDNSGPTRIIFPYDSFKIDPVRYNDLWIWNINSIQVN